MSCENTRTGSVEFGLNIDYHLDERNFSENTWKVESSNVRIGYTNHPSSISICET